MFLGKKSRNQSHVQSEKHFLEITYVFGTKFEKSKQV